MIANLNDKEENIKLLNAQHLSKSNEHFTPGSIIGLAREILGTIDIDPFSCAKANEYIKAKQFYGLDNELDGWEEPWSGNAWINAPGGRSNGKSNQKRAWRRLMEQYDCGNVKSAIFLSFNLDLMQTVQVKQEGKLPMEFPFCLPKTRIAYLKPDLSQSMNPTHASAIFFISPKDKREEATVKFKSIFSSIGHCVIPSN